MCVVPRPQRALRGHVRNTTTGVLIDVEGEGGTIEQFITEPRAERRPSAASSLSQRSDPSSQRTIATLRIVESAATGEKLSARRLTLPPATGLPSAILFDATDRRYHFTGCEFQIPQNARRLISV